MAKTEEQRTEDLNRVLRRVCRALKPPERLPVDKWADKYRRLSPKVSAEAGPWRTSRTPYLREPMRAFSDPRVRHIVMASASQSGKTECELNIIGSIIDQDPSSILVLHPSVEEAKKFSRMRIDTLIEATPRLRRKVGRVKQGRDNAQTILQKSFPGGIMTIAGTNVAATLASMPIRYVIGDEVDRWAKSAGNEGDPWGLALARTKTFYNAKTVRVSTPTIKGASPIATAYDEGTRERWCTKCPACGEYSEVNFDSIHFTPLKHEGKGGAVTWELDGHAEWVCPECGCMADEATMKRQPAKWIAENPIALDVRATRSFWLNAFASPWETWDGIILQFLDAKNDPRRLQVVYNTLLGQLWEDRGDIETEDVLLARREEYGQLPDGRQIDCPDGVLVLTAGVDTQDNRLEYEIVGHGLYGETWGIERGVLNGRPSSRSTWEKLNGVIDRPYLFGDGRTIRVSAICVDSQGHYTNEVYAYCRSRQNRGVLAIMGKGGETIPYTSPPTKRPINDDKRYTCWLYTLGVDAGKEKIMDSLRVREPGPNYCHFPLHLSAGYDMRYFSGLLSEHKVRATNSTRFNWKWEKIPGHERNEPLDCRNYALAALQIMKPDLHRMKQRQIADKSGKSVKKSPKPTNKRKKRQRKDPLATDW